MSVTVNEETDSKLLPSNNELSGTVVETGVTVNNEAAGSSPARTANEFYDDQEALFLVPFKPKVPAEVSIGIMAARQPEQRRKLKKVFLDALRATASVVDAAKICQIPKTLAFAWRHEDPEFRTIWDEIVKGELLPQLEAEAIRRALNGSDLMLIFMLKAMDRSKYDDKAAEKIIDKPSVTIQIRDVDKSLVAIASSNNEVPAINYGTGKQLDGKKAESATINAEFEEIKPGNESPASAKTVGEK